MYSAFVACKYSTQSSSCKFSLVRLMDGEERWEDPDPPHGNLPQSWGGIKLNRTCTSSHQANELSLNDCLWPGPNLNPNLLDVLINFRLNRVAISSDIRQAFLQICLADKHKDFVRFLWTDSNPRIGEAHFASL
ncbi:DUF1758 domain-containing protein [Trichonephila clavipes]|nr:DUF1758 domain-containing protein [Trichonephila clavipes]